MEKAHSITEPVIDRGIHDDIFNSILSEPIVYIPQNYYSYLRKILNSFIKDNAISNYLSINTTNVLEYDTFRGIYDMNGEKIGDCRIERFLADIVDHESDTVDDISDCKIFILYGAMSSIVESKDCINQLVEFANGYYEGKFDQYTTIFIIENFPCSLIPVQLSSFISIIDIPFPDKDVISKFIDDIDISNSIPKQEIPAFKNKFCCLFKGLQQTQIMSILNSVLPKTGHKLSEISYSLCEQEKKRAIKKTNVLELVAPDVSLDDIGGLEALKRDIRNKSIIFKNLSLATARFANIPIPKGVLILGMPGCGKSMIAKAIASEFGIPMLRLDIGRLMGKFVGESEENLRTALNTAEASHPCILWIDEVEKAFAGNNSGGNGDSLVVRLMGSFLTWMQERKNPVYIIATANDAMRPEFMRKGRFDEVYFVNFPNRQETAEILKNKLKKYRHKDSIFDFQSIGKDSIDNIVERMQGGKYGGFSGSEIEAVVNTIVEQGFISYIESGRNHSVLIRETDFNKTIDKMKSAIMANQSGTQNSKSNIERILELQKMYCFKSASLEENRKK